MLKNKMHIKLISLVLIAFLMFSASGYTSVKVSNTIDTQKAELVNGLESVLTAQDGLSFSKLESNYQKMEEVIGDFTDSDLLAVLNDNTLDSTTKSAILQMSDGINGGKGIEDSSAFIAYLKDESLSEDIRVNLIHSVNLEDADIKEAIIDIIKNEEGATVTRSMIVLKKSDALLALKTAEEILKNTTDYNYDNIRAAITVKAEYYLNLTLSKSTKDIAEEKRQFVEQSISIYNNCNDSKVQDTIAFALMDMLDFEAVKAVIQNEKIDEDLKITCIRRNAHTFIEKINSNPTLEEVDFIIKVMEKVPLKELSQTIKEKLLPNKAYDTNRLSNVIALIDSFGIEADNTWLE